ncbi:MAG: tetraacyldisaccharide 4'-kinase [Thermodesulfobacteriota bacterium]
MEKWMRGEVEPPFVLSVAIALLARLYGAGVRARSRLYGLGILRARRLPKPVISVGNLTVGGTGKTPVVIHIAAFLVREGTRPVILSRGYKGSARGLTVVSDGTRLLAGPAEAGDEPYLAATRLPGVPVIVCKDRARAGEYAVKKFSPDFILLDDGFQHLALARDVNILLVDSRTGFGGGRLLPRGVLREPVSAARRADVVLLKGGGGGGGAAARGDIPQALKALGKPVLRFDYRPVALVNVADGSEASPKALGGKSVAALSALADPRSFHSSLEALGARVAEAVTFPDHHAYTREDLERVKDAAAGADFVVTTEKDAVKLKGLAGAMEVHALTIEVDMDEGGLEKLFAPYLKGLGGGGGS